MRGPHPKPVPRGLEVQGDADQTEGRGALLHRQGEFREGRRRGVTVVPRLMFWCRAAGSESREREGGGRDRRHRGLLLAAGGAHQTVPGDRRSGVRGGVRLPGERLHPLLQQSPRGEAGTTAALSFRFRLFPYQVGVPTRVFCS